MLTEALTHKKIIAKGEEVGLETVCSVWLCVVSPSLTSPFVSPRQLMSPLNLEQASSARDALSKAVYGRTFTWLVNKINASLANTVNTPVRTLSEEA